MCIQYMCRPYKFLQLDLDQTNVFASSDLKKSHNITISTRVILQSCKTLNITDMLVCHLWCSTNMAFYFSQLYLYKHKCHTDTIPNVFNEMWLKHKLRRGFGHTVICFTLLSGWDEVIQINEMHKAVCLSMAGLGFYRVFLASGVSYVKQISYTAIWYFCDEPLNNLVFYCL